MHENWKKIAIHSPINYCHETIKWPLELCGQEKLKAFLMGFGTFKEEVTQVTIHFCSSNSTTGPCVVAPGCCGICRSHATRQTPSQSLLSVFRGLLDTPLWPNSARYSCATNKQQQTFGLILRRKAACLEWNKQTHERPEDHAEGRTYHLVRPDSKQVW